MIYVLVLILYLIEPGSVKEFIIFVVVIVQDLNDSLMIYAHSCGFCKFLMFNLYCSVYYLAFE